MPFPEPGARGDAAPGPERLLAELTPEQAQAVTHGSGQLLLLAGPGAGKTRTLTHRAAYLLATGRARPGEILAVTFSVRAAGELRLRLADLLGEEVARAVTAATFHSVCARLLRSTPRCLGGPSATPFTTRAICAAWSTGCFPTPTEGRFSESCRTADSRRARRCWPRSRAPRTCSSRRKATSARQRRIRPRR